jgi:hypothetical protein
VSMRQKIKRNQEAKSGITFGPLFPVTFSVIIMSIMHIPI